MRLYSKILGMLLLCGVGFVAHGQSQRSSVAPKEEYYIMHDSQMDNLADPYMPKLAVKSNLLYMASTTINGSLEFGLAKHWSMDLTAAYNPFKLQNEGTNQVWFVQPELRYWLCQRFERHFVGLHGIYGAYNVGQVDFLTTTFKTHRYKGTAFGAGISYGYHAPIGRRWAVELSVGAGFMRLDYDKYRCVECDDYIGSKKVNYFGPTKAAITLVYMIK